MPAAPVFRTALTAAGTVLPLLLAAHAAPAVSAWGPLRNRTMPGTPPVVAAQTVAGNFVASAVSITFDPTQPCPLKAQASITVT